MKKLLLLIALVAFSQTSGFAQGCLSSGITISSQAQIDNFQSNYPGCTIIEGSASISGGDIVNLSGLNVLTQVYGVLSIGYNPVLTSLAGLEMLSMVGGSFIIGNNVSLVSLSALESLSYVGYDFKIGNNPNLTSIVTGGKLGQIYANLEIVGNGKLSSLIGFESLQHVGGTLMVSGNTLLSSLAGLDNIDGNSILSLYISSNPNLSTCEVESVCEYLAQPGASVFIENNASGCNTRQEVESACHLAIESTAMKDFDIFPNPATGLLTIETPENPIKSQLTIFNLSGQEILAETITEPKTLVDIRCLTPGIYFYRLQTGTQSETGKMILLK